MKKVLFGLFVMLSSTAVMAQGRGEGRGPGGGQNMTPEQRVEMQTKRLSEQLNLSEEQQKKVYTLNLDREKKFREAREQGGNNDRRAFMEQYEKDLNAILTPEQQAKRKEQQAEMRNRRPGEGRPNVDATAPERKERKEKDKKKKAKE